MPPIKFFLPGPTYVREEVRARLTAETAGHRSTEFRSLYAAVTERLRPVFRTAGEVMTASASSTLVMESAIVSLVAGRVLHLTNGAFAERWQAISRAAGKDVDVVSVAWGEAIDPDDVRRALERKRYDAVTVTHSETSTGVLSPLAEIAGVVRHSSEALLLVDAVSSLGAACIETDSWGLDLVLAGTQKALALPPGLVVFSLSQRAAERAQEVSRRGFYTDLLRYRDKHRAGGTITTPCTPLYYALAEQLDAIESEGLERRWARHARMRATIERWAGAAGFSFAAEQGERAPSLSCLQPPPGVPARALVDALERRGIVIGGGYGKWRDSTVRIGHMGDVRPSDVEWLLPQIDEGVAAVAGRADESVMTRVGWNE